MNAESRISSAGLSAGRGGGASCLVCGRGGAQVFFALDHAPVLCNAPCDSREAARAFPAGPVKLAFCPGCGLIFNCAFDPALPAYDGRYENSLHFSGIFDSYVRDLAADLVHRFDLRGKDIVEIGCGKGDFLALLCGLGGNRGVGFDPSFEPDRPGAAALESVRIVRGFYGPAYSGLPCDFLCCRQTLEHIPAPVPFLEDVRAALAGKPDAVAFFEVPNALFTLRHGGIWDILYEHVCYYWSAPLRTLFETCGFAVQGVRETYGRQYLCLEAAVGRDAGSSPGERMDRVAAEVQSFAVTFRASVDAVSRTLDRLRAAGQRAVVWGAGTKGVMFLNLFRDNGVIEYAVDVNPHKQGKYVPGTGHPIVPPESLVEYRPDAVFVMNPLYRGEIADMLSRLHLQPELVEV